MAKNKTSGLKATDYEMFMMIKRLENRLDSMEDLFTIITRTLVSKGVYTVEEAFDEYGKLGKERAREENKINLEAEIIIEN